MTAEDLALRYHVRLDGLARGVLSDMLADIDGALRHLEAEIARRTPEATPFTYGRLIELRTELTALRTALSERLAGRLAEALDAVVDTSAALAGQTVNALAEAAGGNHAAAAALAVQASFTEAPVAMLATVKAEPFDGLTWTRWGAKLVDDTMARVESELRQSIALGEAMADVRDRLANVADLSKVSAERLARTSIMDVANRARLQSLTKIGGDLIKGWRFVATLDGRTSAICRALDGRVFGAKDPNLRRPPRHPNCRSVLVPIVDLADEAENEGERPFVRSTTSLADMGPENRQRAKERVGAEAWSKLSEKERLTEVRAARERWQRENIGQVPASTDYQTWLRRQPEEFQREVLGPTRFAAFQRGLDLGQMATYDRPLSVDELRRLYPQQMRGL